MQVERVGCSPAQQVPCRRSPAAGGCRAWAGLRLLALGSGLAGGFLAAQGVEGTAGFVLGNTPRLQVPPQAPWAQGWTVGAGIDMPLAGPVFCLLEPRFTRLTEHGATAKNLGLGAMLGFGRAAKTALLVGLARQRETTAGTPRPDLTRTWVKVSLRLPGLMFPVPTGTPIATQGLGASRLRVFTRLEYAQSLQDTRAGNSWQFNWSFGLRCGWLD